MARNSGKSRGKSFPEFKDHAEMKFPKFKKCRKIRPPCTMEFSGIAFTGWPAPTDRCCFRRGRWRGGAQMKENVRNVGGL